MLKLLILLLREHYIFQRGWRHVIITDHCLFNSFYLDESQKNMYYVWTLQMHCEIISYPNVALYCITQMPVNLQSYQILSYFCTQRLSQYVHPSSWFFLIHYCEDKKKKTLAVSEEKIAKQKAKIVSAACVWDCCIGSWGDTARSSTRTVLLLCLIL